MVQPKCLFCGKRSDLPACAACVATLRERQPLLFYPFLLPWDPLEALARRALLVVRPDGRVDFADAPAVPVAEAADAWARSAQLCIGLAAAANEPSPVLLAGPATLEALNHSLVHDGTPEGRAVLRGVRDLMARTAVSAAGRTHWGAVRELPPDEPSSPQPMPPPPTSANTDFVERAQRFLEMGRYDDALRCYDALLTVNARDEAGWFDRGEILALMGRPAEAITSYSRALEINPQNRRAQMEVANLLFDLGRLEEAAHAYQQILREAPAAAEELNQKARSLMEQGRHNDAVLVFNCILELNPRDLAANVGLGDALLALGDLRVAENAYERAAEAHPGNPEALYKKARILEKTGRWGAAIQLLNRVVGIDWKHAEAWVAKGNILRDHGRHDEAMECYRRALEIDPSSDRAWLSRSKALYARGDFGEALTSVHRALEANPANEEAKALRAQVESTRGQVHGFKVLTLDSAELQWMRVAAETLLSEGNLEGALQMFDALLQQAPKDARAWLGRASACERLGRTEEAQRCYGKVLELDPSNETARNALQESVKVVRRKVRAR